MNLLDFIFPKQCVACKKFGSYLCGDCLERIEYLEIQTCAYCYKPAISGKTHPKCFKKFGLDGVVSLTNYKTPVKELIKSLKYRYTTDLLKEIEEKFTFRDEVILERNSVLLPLPLFESRRNYRGFNQAELLGQIVAKRLGLSYKDDLLQRIVATKPQVGLSQKQRAENVRNAFGLKNELEKTTYYVFDDVWTSGATLKEVAKILKQAGAEVVWGLTFSHPR